MTATETFAQPTSQSRVLTTPAAPPDDARRFFAAKLAVETDAADVAHDLLDERRTVVDHPGFVLLDARGPKAFDECHIPGARSLPHAAIDASTTAELSADRLLVVYCWSSGCNAATKAAVRLAALGFQVKEMIGGIASWRHEGYPVEGTRADDAPLYG